MLTDFGQPLSGVVQFAYTVPDIEEAMREQTARLGVGPWFVYGPFRPLAGSYRGQQCSARLTLALGFCGHTMMELIQQHDDAPSVFRERIEAAGYGFHHWGIAVPDIDAAVADYTGQGLEVAFSDRVPSGARIAYIDTLASLPGMVELIEFTPAQHRRYTAMYAAAVGWDGSDPVRRAAAEAGS
jgi:Glyoxalase/Bleomycin resistance protein/Dioxygenase superfamily